MYKHKISFFGSIVQYKFIGILLLILFSNPDVFTISQNASDINFNFKTTASGFKVDGKLVDKLGNPAVDKTADFIRHTAIADTDQTDVNGAYELIITTTGIDDPTQENEEMMTVAGNPVPANGSRIQVNMQEDGILQLAGIDGKVHYQIPLEGHTQYQFTYGGQSQNGQAISGLNILNVIDEKGTHDIEKLIVTGDYANAPLQLASRSFRTPTPTNQNVNFLKSTETEKDTIHFHGANMTELYLEVEHNQTDMSLGNTVVNVGPDVIAQFNTIILETNENYSINLSTDVFYNDETGTRNFEVNNDHFTINGNFLEYTAPSSAATEYVTIVERDLEDPSLTKSIPVVFVTNQTENQAPNVPPYNPVTINEEQENVQGASFNATDDNTALEDLVTSVAGFDKVQVSIDPTTKIPSFSSPELDWYGSETGQVTFTDEEQLSTTIDVTVNVENVEDAPRVVNDNYSTNYATPITVSPTDNDSDPEGNMVPSTLEIVTDFSNGTIVNHGDGTITYTQNNSYSGSDTAEYTVKDATGKVSERGTITIVTREQGNTPPNLSGFTNVEFTEDQGYTGETLDARVSDTQTADENITWEITTGDANVSVALDAQRRPVYSTTQDWNGGPVNVTFKAIDEGGLSNSATIEANILADNDAPTFNGNIADFTVTKDQTYTIDAKNFFADIDSQNLTYSIAGLDNGIYTLNNGVFTITGTTIGADTGIKLAANDGEFTAESNSFKMTVEAQANNAPTITTIADAVFNESPNAQTGVDLDDYVSDDHTTDANMQLSASSNNSNISVSVNATHKLVYQTTNEDYFGLATITVSAQDEGGLVTNSTHKVTFNNVPDNPIAVNDSFSTEYQTAKTVNPVANDTDVENDIVASTLTITQQPAHGSIVNNGNGTITYTPNNGYSGSDIIKYTIKDATNLISNEATATFVTGAANNTAPNLGDIPNIAFNEGENYIGVTLDDYISDDFTSDANMQKSISSNNNKITASLNGEGKIVYATTETNYFGEATITVSITDEGGLSTSKTHTATVNNVNDAPVFTGSIADFTKEIGLSYSIDAKNFFSDIDTQTLTYAITGLDNGSYTLANGVFTITATSAGEDTGIKLTANDGEYTAESNAFKMTVPAANTAPNLDDIADVAFNEGATLIGVTLNDYISDDYTSDANMQKSISSSNNKITATLNGEGKLEYATTDENYFGEATITVSITDEGGLSTSKTHTATVNNVNDAPTFSGSIADFVVTQNNTKVIDAKSYFADIDTPTLTYSILGLDNGSYTLTNGVFTITGSTVGDDTGIKLTANDGEYTVESNAFKMTVEAPANDAPVISTLPDISFNEDANHVGASLDGYVTDDHTADENIQWSVSSSNSKISVSIDADRKPTYATTENDYYGTATITFTAKDEGNLSTSKTQSVTVNNVNDAPTFSGSIADFVVTQNNTKAIDAKNFFADIDTPTLTYAITGLDNGSYTLTNGVFTITGSTVGEDTGIKLTANDGEYTTESNAFKMTVEAPVNPKVNITFDLDAVSGGNMGSGTATLYYKLQGAGAWTQDSTKTFTDQVTLALLKNRTYEINITHTGSIDAAAGVQYLALLRSGDLEAFEQRAGGDASSPITTGSSNETIHAYKLKSDFPAYELYMYTGGSTKKVSPSNKNMNVWIRTDGDHQALNTETRSNLDAILGNIESNTYLNFNVVESATAPSGPYLEIGVKNGYPTGSNGFSTNSSNYITNAEAHYAPWPVERVLKIEVVQAILALQDVGGSDPYVLNPSSSYNLNTTGEKIAKFIYTFKPCNISN